MRNATGVKHKPIAKQPAKSSSPLGSSSIRAWHIGLVLALALLCYAQTAVYQFVWDDSEQIVANSRIRSFSHLGEAFQENFWAFYGASAQSHYYRPLQTVTYMIGYAFGGLSPVPYHWLNILLHMMSSLALLWLAWELFRDEKIALWAGLLFAAHPMHTESVAWAAGVTDVGCGLFYFVSLASWLRSNRSGQSWRWLSGLAFLAALLFKEMALTLPAVVIGLQYVQDKDTGNRKWSRRFASWSPLVLALAIYVALRIHALGSFAPQPTPLPLRFWDRMLTVAYLLGLYVTKLFLPVSQNAYRLFEPFSRLAPAHWIPALVTLSVFVGMAVICRRNLKLLIVAGWALIALAPVLSFESVGQNVFAERYLYIPSAGFCLFLPGIARSLGTKFSQRQVQVFGIAIVAAFALLTLKRNPVWRDEKTLYLSTLSVSPWAAMMHQNLGDVYYREGNSSAALNEFEAAFTSSVRAFVPSKRDQYNALIGISTVYLDTDRLEQAWQTASEAGRLDQGGAEAYFLLGTIRSKQERDAEAESLLKKAVALKPDHVAAQINLGSVLISEGKPAEAAQHFRLALQIDARSLPAQVGIAMSYEQTGHHSEAVRMLKEVLAQDPGNPYALQLLRQMGLR
jgi:tetratricopeptide (TPR) repeat protein